MGRYQLDNLGWYHFENLIQSLLKAVCGLSVESWGKRQDLGRDAFCQNRLSFPAKEQNEGPFIFQVKFVNANASGAKSEEALVSAVNKEKSAIRQRKKNPIWQDPKYLTLITNAPLSAGSLRI